VRSACDPLEHGESFPALTGQCAGAREPGSIARDSVPLARFERSAPQTWEGVRIPRGSGFFWLERVAWQDLDPRPALRIHIDAPFCRPWQNGEVRDA